MATITYRIDKINLSEEAFENPTVTVMYKLQSDPEGGAFYTTAAENVACSADGTLSTPVKIVTLEEDTEYTIKYILNNNQSTFIENNIKTPLQFATGSMLDKVHNLMPNMQVETFETGLWDSYLPEKIGVLHELKNSKKDSFDQFGNIVINVVDENVAGGGFIKRDNEICLQVNDNVSGLYLDPTEDEGNNELSLIGEDGKMPYSIGLWVYFNDDEWTQTHADGKWWLWYCGNVTNHVGAYINQSTKYVHWVHKKDSVVEEMILDHAVEKNKWIKITFRRDGNFPADGWINQMLMKIDSGYFSPSSPTYFSDSTLYEGSIDNEIYFAMGKKSTGTLQQTECAIKYIYYRQTVVDNGLRDRLLNPFYPRAIIRNVDDSGTDFIIEPYQFITITNNKASFVIPHDVPTGDKKLIIKTYSNERTPVLVNIKPFEKRTTDLIIDFTDSEVDNRAAVSDNFYALHKAWGGYGNGGVVADNIYMKDGLLISEAHGDNYDDYDGIQGVNRDSTPKFDTIESHPNFGDNPYYGKAWVRRVGSCLVTKDYFGYGRYLTRARIPKVVGAAPAWWSFYYSENYMNTPEWESLLAAGYRKQGNAEDGYYIVVNMEIDIENCSHLVHGVFNGWTEVQNNVLFFYTFVGEHIGIQNDIPANNGLWKLVNTSAPNLKSSWVKVGETWDTIDQPKYTNSKFNNWRGELGSGNGWRFKDPSIPDSEFADEYLAMLTDMGINTADGEFHDFEYRWYSDRVEFYIDGILKQVNEAYVPDIPARYTLGLWYPSSTDSSGLISPPWLPKPASQWAGHPANYAAVHMEIEKIIIEPYDEITAGGTERLIGESYPYDGYRTLEL